MFFRLLLFLLAIQLNSLHAQQTNEWALNAGLEVHHFAKATQAILQLIFISHTNDQSMQLAIRFLYTRNIIKTMISLHPI